MFVVQQWFSRGEERGLRDQDFWLLAFGFWFWEKWQIPESQPSPAIISGFNMSWSWQTEGARTVVTWRRIFVRGVKIFVWRNSTINVDISKISWYGITIHLSVLFQLALKGGTVRCWVRASWARSSEIRCFVWMDSARIQSYAFGAQSWGTSQLWLSVSISWLDPRGSWRWSAPRAHIIAAADVLLWTSWDEASEQPASTGITLMMIWD